MRRILPFAYRRRISRAFLCVVCLALAIALSITVFMQLTRNGWNCSSASQKDQQQHPEEVEEVEDSQTIDVVYTWVNGSEERFLNTLRRYANELSPHPHPPHLDVTRYDDKNELLFSLRSLQIHFWPWIRRVHIISNGQLPHWLDLDNDRIRFHTHSELVARDPVAEEQMLLPTFSSAAIETLIYLIPDLTPRFLYLNDDVFIGRLAFLSDLWTAGGGAKVFRVWSLPDCAPDCPWTYVADGACDLACDCESCQWDGGDCAVGNNNVEKGAGSSTATKTAELVIPKVSLHSHSLSN